VRDAMHNIGMARYRQIVFAERRMRYGANSP
jgi:hypothetical protein